MEMSRQRIRTSVLESSTEKCVHCGGTGHVRSVSSVALQLLRSIEETLLKGPTHNLIVRTRPEIALYVLNHKRAHLRGLEERFRVALTVNADEAVGGQTGFVIERGEQVMSIEQAKALVAQAETAPVLIEEEEPETIETADDLEDSEAGEPAEQAAAPHEFMPAEPLRDGEMDRDGGEQMREGGRGRRRRRRRGRGGRGGEERGHGQFAQHGGEHRPFEPAAGNQEQPSEFAPAGNGDLMPGDHAPMEARAPHDHSDNGDQNGGERRRRRRGRRGGRRNRRDRDGQHADFAGAPAHEGRDNYDRPAHNDQGQWNERRDQPGGDIAEATHAPRIEPMVVPQPVEQPVTPAAPPPPAEPPRRRSTVREPAPVFGGSSSIATPMPAPEPPATPASTIDAAAAEDTSKPRRTGWWAKRLLGGDKG
jgi:ribonuclease E